MAPGCGQTRRTSRQGLGGFLPPPACSEPAMPLGTAKNAEGFAATSRGSLLLPVTDPQLPLRTSGAVSGVMNALPDAWRRL